MKSEEEEEDEGSASSLVSAGSAAVLGFLVDEADGLVDETLRVVRLLGLAGIPRTPPMEGRLKVFKEFEPRCGGGGGGLPSSDDTCLRFVRLLGGDVIPGPGAVLSLLRRSVARFFEPALISNSSFICSGVKS